MIALRKNCILIGLMTVAVALAAGAAGLSVIPHTHGSDLDHSKHTSCPVHQIEQQGFLGETLSVVFQVFFACLGLQALLRPWVLPQVHVRFLPSRAPPACI